MFSLGFVEIFLILILILIFVRPSDYPKICFYIGRYYQKVLIFKSKILDLYSQLSLDYEDSRRSSTKNTKDS